MRAVRLVLGLFALVVVARLVQVEVLRSSTYRSQALSLGTEVVPVPAVRGAIYDRNGQVLALSVPTDDVVADDQHITHPASEAAALAPLLGVPVSALTAQLSHHKDGYVVLARQLPVAKAHQIAQRAFAGITLAPNSKQTMPDGQLALPVLGILNGQGQGISGIQYRNNAQLSGTAGSEVVAASPSGVVLPGSAPDLLRPAHPGIGLELTIDQPLQYEAEQALAAQILSTNSQSGIAVVMDVHSGQILAMANLVASSSRTAGKAGSTSSTSSTSSAGASRGSGAGPVDIGPSGPVQEAPSNLAVTQVYEPGSVFKIVTFSAALQDGIISPSTTFTVPDQITLDGSIFHDAEVHPTQKMTATQILAQSSNIGTSEIAQALGEQKLLDQVTALGFGRPTGLNFPGDSPGLIAGPSQWEPTNWVSLPIGQVDAVSAQQVLDAFNAVANGGLSVQPRLVRATVGPGGDLVPTVAPAPKRVMSTTVAQELTGMFEHVVTAQGTAPAAAVPGYVVAGKTGSSQIPSTGKNAYVPGAFMATFVGFAPASHPQLSAIVVLDRPTGYYGGTEAAPVFSEIMSYALRRYGVPPSSPTSAALRMQGGA